MNITHIHKIVLSALGTDIESAPYISHLFMCASIVIETEGTTQSLNFVED
jgi:hypothetical protein